MSEGYWYLMIYDAHETVGGAWITLYDLKPASRRSTGTSKACFSTLTFSNFTSRRWQAYHCDQLAERSSKPHRNLSFDHGGVGNLGGTF